MNRIEAVAQEITEHEGVCRIVFYVGEHSLAMVGLQPPAGFEKGGKVVLGIKATHLFLSLEKPRGSTLTNALPVTIEAIDAGRVLAVVKMRFEATPMEAIVSVATLTPLNLSPGKQVYALLPESELAILEIVP